jgi:inorganic pyrophosphatase
MKTLPAIIFSAAVFLAFSCDSNKTGYTNQTYIDTHDFLRDFTAYSKDSFVNIIVEIPAGCNQKWEVNKQTGILEWEFKDSLRVVRYQPYPANYGMVPSTWQPKEEGGDNDPIDVFLLGLRHERGSVVKGKIVGVIRMLDKGYNDDKLIAVPQHEWFANISSLAELDSTMPGAVEILVKWLANYKGGNKVEIIAVESEILAIEVLNKSINAYGISVGNNILK